MVYIYYISTFVILFIYQYIDIELIFKTYILLHLVLNKNKMLLFSKVASRYLNNLL